MEIFSVLLILFVVIGAIYLIKLKIDEGIITEKEKNQIINTSIKISSKKIKSTNITEGFLFYINRCLSNYANFDGVASRSEFWYFYLFTLIVGLITLGIDYYFFNELFEKYGGIASIIASLFLVVPSLSVSSRRLHDIGKSGWWIMIYFTIIGIIVLYVWYATKSNPKLNKKYK
jgi:uncharacterized membrane protein YhaH (DUF805 family)